MVLSPLSQQQRLSLLEQLLDRRFSSVETVVRGMRGELETGMRKVRADARESLEGLQDVAASIRRLESALDRISRAVGLQEGASMAPKEAAASSGAKLGTRVGHGVSNPVFPGPPGKMEGEVGNRYCQLLLIQVPMKAWVQYGITVAGEH